MFNNASGVYLDADNRPRRFVGSVRQGNEHFDWILGGTVNDGTMSARDAAHARWLSLPLKERRSIWLHYAMVGVVPALAGAAFVVWAVHGGWWLPPLGVALAVQWVWQLGVLWILHRDRELDLVQRRRLFATLNNAGSAIFDLGVALFVLGVWLLGEPAKPHWVLPLLAGGFVLAGASDAHAAWKGRRVRRRTVST